MLGSWKPYKKKWRRKMDDHSMDAFRYVSHLPELSAKLAFQMKDLFKWKDPQEKEITLEEWNRLNREIENGM